MATVRELWEKCNIRGAVARYDEPMSLHTSFQVGGPADAYVEPEDLDAARAVLDAALAAGIPTYLVGGGSNLVVADRGIRGLVVSLASLSSIDVISSGPDETVIRSGAGVLMDGLADWCAERSLSGVERFAGLPGTVGGAVYMNARCYDLSVSDVLDSVIILSPRDKGCTLEEVPFDASGWAYKRSPFQRAGAEPLRVTASTPIVAAADFRTRPGSRAGIEAEMARFRSDRELKGHFRFPSAGSMFKNDRAFGKPTGQIVDELGLRGLSVGGAAVAPWHGNIVINTGTATARDIRELVRRVKDAVRERTGFDLECEVVFAGDWEGDNA